LILGKKLSKNHRIKANPKFPTARVPKRTGKVTVNAFIVPRNAVYKYGEPVSHWRIYVGLSL
jgi:hypothetical protein